MNAETQAALALVNAGLSAASVERFLPTLGLVESDTAETIGTKVEQLKTELPQVFGAASGGRGQQRPAVTPIRRPPGYEFGEMGRQALKRAGIKPREPQGDGPAAA